MRFLVSAMAMCTALFFSGCEKQDTYPVTGEECGPNDPVLELDANSCTPI